MLAVMFSGRHNVTTDEDGRYFLDRDGTHFRYILNYLRDGNTYLPVDNQQLIDELYEEVCRGVWARVTMDRFRHSSHSTVKKRKPPTDIFSNQILKQVEAAMEKLLAGADVFVSNLRVTALERLGLGPRQLK